MREDHLEKGEFSKTDEKSRRLATAVKEGQDHLVLRLLQAGVPVDGVDDKAVSLFLFSIFLSLRLFFLCLLSCCPIVLLLQAGVPLDGVDDEAVRQETAWPSLSLKI